MTVLGANGRQEAQLVDDGDDGQDGHVSLVKCSAVVLVSPYQPEAELLSSCEWSCGNFSAYSPQPPANAWPRPDTTGPRQDQPPTA